MDENKKSWLSKEGELTVDVYKTDKDIIIQTPVAGIDENDLEIITEKDMIIIKGQRNRPENGEPEEFFIKECFWGPFSRKIILPEETDPSRAKALMNKGVLTIKIPRIEREKRREVNLSEDE